MNKHQTILLASCSIIFSFLAVPFLYRWYDEDFDASEWRTYVRMLVPFVGLLAGVTLGQRLWPAATPAPEHTPQVVFYNAGVDVHARIFITGTVNDCAASFENARLER